VATTFGPASFQLWVRNNSQFTQVTTGAPASPGRFVFTDVPAGQRYLRRGSTWVVDPPPTVDFSFHALGRGDVSRVDGGVTLSLATSGMAPWTSGTEIQLISGNAGLMGFHFERGLTNPLAGGVAPTTLSFDYARAYAASWGRPAPLIEASKGDLVYLTTLSPGTFATDGGAGVPMRVLSRAASPALDLGGAPGPAPSAAFAVPSSLASVSVNWRRSAYWAQGSQVTPNFVPWLFDFFDVAAIPYFGDEGLYAAAPDLLMVGEVDTPGPVADLTISTSIANPYPASWPLHVLLQACHSGPPQTAGGTETVLPYGCATRLAPLASVNGHALAPGLSPPTNLRVDGQPAYGALTIALTPTISWSAPSTGTPIAYEVELRRFVNASTAPVDSSAGQLFTKGLSVTLPPGMLQSGEYYYLRVIAVSGFDPTATPFKTALEREYATGITGVLRAQ